MNFLQEFGIFMELAPKNNTAQKILDVTQDFIQIRGYSAISINDIAVEVGIKKPSVIHHFPNKAALGMAVVKRYRVAFAAGLSAIQDDPQKTAADALEYFFMPYLMFGKAGNKVCLCGALAGEFTALPISIRNEVTHFFEEHLSGLQDVLTQGLSQGSFQFADPPETFAQFIMDSLQGALMIKRATGRKNHLINTVNTLRKKVGSAN